MRNFSFTKNSKLVFAVSAAVILLGLIVALTVGLAPDSYTAGDKVYVGKMSLLADVDALDVDAIAADVNKAVGFDVNASVSYDYNDGKASVLIRVPNGVSVDEKALVSMFSANYPELEVTAFNHSFTGADAVGAYFAGFAALLAIALIVAGVAACVLCGWKNGLIVVAAAAHDVLLVFSVYVLARIAHLPLLVGSLFAVIAISAAVNTARIRALRVEKKQTRAEAADAALKENAGSAVMMLVLFFIVMVLFAASAVIAGAAGIAYIAAMVFAVALAVQYSSNIFMPTLWSCAE